ncbi:MAG: hypothetical protein ACOYEI_07800 [Acetivibrionales bacterium]
MYNILYCMRQTLVKKNTVLNMKGMIIMSLLELEQINLELDELKENIIELGDSL